MPIINPTQIVEEFKKSGEFDRLRRELLNEFRNGESIEQLMARVEDIARQKMESEPKLQYMSETLASKELMQELDRYPIVDRAVSDVRMLSDPSFAAGIRTSVRKILQEDRKRKESSGECIESCAEHQSTSVREEDTSITASPPIGKPSQYNDKLHLAVLDGTDDRDQDSDVMMDISMSTESTGADEQEMKTEPPASGGETLLDNAASQQSPLQPDASLSKLIRPENETKGASDAVETPSITPDINRQAAGHREDLSDLSMSTISSISEDTSVEISELPAL